MGRRRRRSQWVLVSLAMRGAGEKMRAGSREKSVSRGGERICCIQSGIGEFCQDGVFSSQDRRTFRGLGEVGKDSAGCPRHVFQ